VDFCRNWAGVWTTVGRAADRRRRRTTTSAYGGGGIAIGPIPCQLIPIDAADYTTLADGSVSVRFPAVHRGIYAVDHYAYINGMATRSRPLRAAK